MLNNCPVFSKDLTQQEAISEEAISRAIEVMHTGRLHRYNNTAGDAGEVALLEQEFAAWLGASYCLATASCGSAIHIALRSAGVQPGDQVLCNAYTLAPVPGAIHNAGATPVFVEINEYHSIDLEDLEQKAKSVTSKFLLLSHMRGHIGNMEKIVDICRCHQITLIEDCAHTMGAGFNGRKSGTFGAVSCFSTQTYKHMNSGEGGLLVTNDPDIISRAIIMSGSYMNYDKHLSRPELDVFETAKWITPNYSGRMDNLRAAILRVQLRDLDNQVKRWNSLYQTLEKYLAVIPGLTCVPRLPQEEYVGSSIQFNLYGQSVENIKKFLEKTEQKGVHIKWFGEPEPVGFTSSYKSWRYFQDIKDLPETNRILNTLCDMRVPLTLTQSDCEIIGKIIDHVAREILV